MTDLEIAEFYSPAALLAQFELAEQDNDKIYKLLWTHIEVAKAESFVSATVRIKLRVETASEAGFVLKLHLRDLRDQLKMCRALRGDIPHGRDLMDFYVDYLSAYDDTRNAFDQVMFDRITALRSKST